MKLHEPDNWIPAYFFRRGSPSQLPKNLLDCIDYFCCQQPSMFQTRVLPRGLACLYNLDYLLNTFGPIKRPKGQKK